jgi:hypothetical protein
MRPLHHNRTCLRVLWILSVGDWVMRGDKLQYLSNFRTFFWVISTAFFMGESESRGQAFSQCGTGLHKFLNMSKWDSLGKVMYHSITVGNGIFQKGKLTTVHTMNSLKN